MRNKKLAITTIIVGGIEGLLALFLSSSFLPKIMQVYEDFGVNIPITTSLTPYIFISPALLSLIVGTLILTSKNNSKRYNSWAIIILIATLIFIFLGLPLLFSVGFLFPMFNLVNVIE